MGKGVKLPKIKIGGDPLGKLGQAVGGGIKGIGKFAADNPALLGLAAGGLGGYLLPSILSGGAGGMPGLGGLPGMGGIPGMGGAAGAGGVGSFLTSFLGGGQPQAGGGMGGFGGFPGILGTGLGAAGSAFDYKQWEKRFNERKKILEKQIAEMQASDKNLQQVKFDPNRYKGYEKFLGGRIAGKGIGAEEKKMQQEGDIRAGRSGAAQRAAALEQMARTTGGMGTGAALASALTGGQSAMDIQSKTNLEREVSAQKNLEEAYAKQAALSSEATKEQAELAQRQVAARQAALGQIGGSRSDLAGLQLEAGERQGSAGKDVAQFGQQVLSGFLGSPTQQMNKKWGGGIT